MSINPNSEDALWLAILAREDSLLTNSEMRQALQKEGFPEYLIERFIVRRERVAGETPDHRFHTVSMHSDGDGVLRASIDGEQVLPALPTHCNHGVHWGYYCRDCGMTSAPSSDDPETAKSTTPEDFAADVIASMNLESFLTPGHCKDVAKEIAAVIRASVEITVAFVITDEMIERAAEKHADLDGAPWAELPERDRIVYRADCRHILGAAMGLRHASQHVAPQASSHADSKPAWLAKWHDSDREDALTAAMAASVKGGAALQDIVDAILQAINPHPVETKTADELIDAVLALPRMRHGVNIATQVVMDIEALKGRFTAERDALRAKAPTLAEAHDALTQRLFGGKAPPEMLIGEVVAARASEPPAAPLPIVKDIMTAVRHYGASGFEKSVKDHLVDIEVLVTALANAATKARAECDEMRALAPGDNGKPWPARDVMATLADAAEHLLRVHDCDCIGHEKVALAREIAFGVLAGGDPEKPRQP